MNRLGGINSYYTSFRDQLVAERTRIRSLTRQPKIQGDYCEALVRDFIGKHIPSGFAVGHGIIYDQERRKPSKECDVIVYEKTGKKPLFESGDLVVVDPKSSRIKFVIQVKSNLNNLKKSITNLRAVKDLDSHIMCGIIGFTTHTSFRTLYLNAWRSGGTIQFLNVFEWDPSKSEKRKDIDDELMESQALFLISFLRYYGSGSYTEHFVIHVGSGEHHDGFARLEKGDKEEKTRDTLSRIYSQGFWSLWDTGFFK